MLSFSKTNILLHNRRNS